MNQKTKEAYDIQYECIDKIKLLADEWSMQAGRPIVANVTTFGCQMNARDSEKLRGILNKAGFQDTENEDDADIVIYNTCTVRDNANQHVFGRLGHLNGVKRNKKDMIIGLCGCMMQEPHIVEKVKKSYPFARDRCQGPHRGIPRASAGRAQVPVQIGRQYHVRVQQLLHLLHRPLCARP